MLPMSEGQMQPRQLRKRLVSIKAGTENRSYPQRQKQPGMVSLTCFLFEIWKI